MTEFEESKKRWSEIKSIGYDEDYIFSDLIEGLIKQLQQYKSIVKAVDPDNLPEGEVLLFESNDFINSGVLENTSDGILLSGRWGNIEFFDLNITHYIETKDIIKLLG